MSVTDHSGITAPTFDPASPVPQEYDVVCESCGYSLVGLTGDRCPECGAPFARIPWLHRRRLGRWRAYWQTVRQVVFRPREFAAELCRPVRISADDARRFRGLTILLAATTAAVTVAVLVFFSTSMTGVRMLEFLGVAAALLGGWLGSVVFLRLATDVPVFIWKGHPAMQPHELAPLHHYAAAPLAALPVLAVFAAILPALAEFTNAPEAGEFFAYSLAAMAVAGWLFLWWRTPIALMRTATGCGWWRALGLALYLPAHWALMALLVALGVGVIVAGVGAAWEALF